jgi:hypothetical protein
VCVCVCALFYPLLVSLVCILTCVLPRTSYRTRMHSRRRNRSNSPGCWAWMRGRSLCAHTYIHSHRCTDDRHTYTHILSYSLTCIFPNVHTHVCQIQHIHTHTHTHIYTYTHTHTHTHTRTHTCAHHIHTGNWTQCWMCLHTSSSRRRTSRRARFTSRSTSNALDSPRRR